MSPTGFQRDAFFDRLHERARTDKDIVLVAADMSAPALDKFRTDLPSQFVNVGIAEQNAIQITSGLAMHGKTAFCYAISPFITLRVLEQIRVSNCIMKIPITIVGMGTGLSYENDGPTHHLIEDIAVMRAFPGITIHNITDNVMAAAMVDISCEMNTTNYIRLDKDAYAPLYGADADFSSGLAKLRDGCDNILLTSGVMSHVAVAVAEKLKQRDITVGVVDIFEIPIRTAEFIPSVKDAQRLITLEEHFLAGGLGSAVCELLNDERVSLPVKRIGMENRDGYRYSYTYGGRKLIRQKHGIDTDSVVEKIVRFIDETS